MTLLLGIERRNRWLLLPNKLGRIAAGRYYLYFECVDQCFYTAEALLLALPVLPNPIADNISHSLAIQRALRVLLIILGAQIPQRQEDPVLHKLVVDYIHSLWRSGSVGRVEADIGGDTIRDVVESDGFVDGVVTVAAEIVDSGVAGDSGLVVLVDGTRSGERSLMFWTEEELACGCLSDE